MKLTSNERIKILSSLYCYNGTDINGGLLSILNKYLHLTGDTEPKKGEWHNGFIGLPKEFDAKKLNSAT